MVSFLQCAGMLRFEVSHLPWWLMSNIVGDRVFGSPQPSPARSDHNQTNTYFIPGFCEWPGIFGKMKEFFRGTNRNVFDVDPHLPTRPMIESAEQIEAAIRPHLDEVPNHEIIGHSRGALLALHVAKKLKIPNVVLLAPPLNGAPLAWLLPWLPSAREMIPSSIFSSFIDELMMPPLPEKTIIVQGGRDGLAQDHYLARLPGHVTLLHLEYASHIDLVRRLEVFLFLSTMLAPEEPRMNVQPLRVMHGG